VSLGSDPMTSTSGASTRNNINDYDTIYGGTSLFYQFEVLGPAGGNVPVTIDAKGTASATGPVTFTYTGSCLTGVCTAIFGGSASALFQVTRDEQTYFINDQACATSVPNGGYTVPNCSSAVPSSFTTDGDYNIPVNTPIIVLMQTNIYGLG